MKGPLKRGYVGDYIIGIMEKKNGNYYSGLRGIIKGTTTGATKGDTTNLGTS